MMSSYPRCRRNVALFALSFGGAMPAALAQTTPGATRPGVAPPQAPAATQAPVGASPSAPPPDGEARGEALRLKGNAAFAGGRYPEALADYEEALKVSQNPKIFYNLGAVHQKMGRNADAFLWLSRFKASAPQEELKRITNLDERIAALRNKVTALKVTVNVGGARVLVRDVAVGKTQANRPLEAWINEGKATVEIMSEGYGSYREEHDLQGGAVLAINVRLTPQTRPLIVLDEKKGAPTQFWSQWWFWASAGALLVGGAVTVYALSTEKSPDKGDHGVLPAPLKVQGVGFNF